MLGFLTNPLFFLFLIHICQSLTCCYILCFYKLVFQDFCENFCSYTPWALFRSPLFSPLFSILLGVTGKFGIGFCFLFPVLLSFVSLKFLVFFLWHSFSGVHWPFISLWEWQTEKFTSCIFLWRIPNAIICRSFLLYWTIFLDSYLQVLSLVAG